MFYIETPNDNEAGGAWLVIQVGATCYEEATAGDTVEEAFMVFFFFPVSFFVRFDEFKTRAL